MTCAHADADCFYSGNNGRAMQRRPDGVSPVGGPGTGASGDTLVARFRPRIRKDFEHASPHHKQTQIRTPRAVRWNG